MRLSHLSLLHGVNRRVEVKLLVVSHLFFALEVELTTSTNNCGNVFLICYSLRIQKRQTHMAMPFLLSSNCSISILQYRESHHGEKSKKVCLSHHRHTSRLPDTQGPHSRC